MKILPCILMMSCLLGSEFLAYASNDPLASGRVSMQGSILNASCSIATDDKNQTIDMGIMTVGEVINSKANSGTRFSLHFIDCILPGKIPGNEFYITFDGASTGGLFDIKGAAGVGLQIRDAEGKIIKPGMPYDIVSYGRDRSVLEYELQLLGNGQDTQAGNYHSVLHYRIDYY